MTSVAPTPRLNAEWHKAHRMPKNATFDQRVEWHITHTQHCACRTPTGAVLDELKKRGIIKESTDTGR